MGLGKKIIDFIAPPIKQKIPKNETQFNESIQDTQKKKTKIGVQEVEEIEYELLENNVNTTSENTTEIPELSVEEYAAEKETQSELKETEQENNTEDALLSSSYQEFEQITQEIETTSDETKNEVDKVVEDITTHYTLADIPIEENSIDNIYTFSLFNTSFLQPRDTDVNPVYMDSLLFQNAMLTYIENPILIELIEEDVHESKFTFSPLSSLSENKKEITQSIEIQENTSINNLSTEKFIFSDNKKSITLPIYINMQTELSNSIDYQPTDIQKITESISLEAPAMNALLKNAVRTIMQRKGIQEITPETLPLIKDDLSLVLEASGSNLSTMVGDVLQIKKIVNDKVNERREKVNEYKNELTQKISQLLAQVRHLEGEVAKLDNIIYTDIEELTKINKTLDTYQMLLASISEQKFNFE